MSYDDFIKKIKDRDQDHALNLPDGKVEKADKKNKDKSVEKTKKKEKEDPDKGLIIQ